MTRPLTRYARATSHYGTRDEGAMVYHGTAVVRWRHHATLLSTGGHRTVTTRLRMNQAACLYRLQHAVFQRKKEWYVEAFDNTFPFSPNDVFPFGQEAIVIPRWRLYGGLLSWALLRDDNARMFQGWLDQPEGGRASAGLLLADYVEEQGQEDLADHLRRYLQDAIALGGTIPDGLVTPRTPRCHP